MQNKMRPKMIEPEKEALGDGKIKTSGKVKKSLRQKEQTEGRDRERE